MLHKSRFRAFAERPDGRHTFETEEALQDVATFALAGPERMGLLELLVERLVQLPEAQKKVLAMYYYEDLSPADIGACFNLSETEIRQIHAEAVDELRKYMYTIWIKRGV